MRRAWLIGLTMLVSGCSTPRLTRAGPVTGQLYTGNTQFMPEDYEREVRVSAYAQAHPGSLTSTQLRNLATGTIWVGMTPELAELGLGKPEIINHTGGANGTHDQWAYHCAWSNDIYCTYLYFDQGKLMNWQTEESKY